MILEFVARKERAQESTKARSCKRPPSHPAFNNVVSGASRRVRRDASRRHNQPDQAPGNSPMLPLGTLPPMSFVHSTFDAVPMFYIPPTTLIQRPDDMLSSPLGQHILDYDPPVGLLFWFSSHLMAPLTLMIICSIIIKQ